MIDYAKYGLGDALKHNNSMDARHAEWVKAALEKLKPQSAIEIGCWAGVSTLAILEAGIPNTHLIDPVIQGSVRSMAADYGAKIHEGLSQDVLPRLGVLPDLAVMIDGAHDYESVRSEWRIVETLQPRVVIIHDVTSPHIGLVMHDGPMWLWHQLQIFGWLCAVDAMPRANEYTQRGMAIATRSMADHALVIQAYKQIAN